MHARARAIFCEHWREENQEYPMRIEREKLDELLTEYGIIYKEMDGKIVIESIDSERFDENEKLVRDLAHLDADFDMEKEDEENIVISIPYVH